MNEDFNQKEYEYFEGRGRTAAVALLVFIFLLTAIIAAVSTAFFTPKLTQEFLGLNIHPAIFGVGFFFLEWAGIAFLVKIT